MYLETVPMPSMEVYSGTPTDQTQHFEDWMQTQYPKAAQYIANWAHVSDEEKATLFMGQLNTYFEERKKLLGDDEVYLFPRNRPNADQLKVIQITRFKFEETRHYLIPILLADCLR